MPPSNRQNISVARTIVTNVAASAPMRKRKRKFAGMSASSSATIRGMQMMAVSIASAIQHHHQHDRDAGGEQKGVGLEVAGLKQAERPSKNVGRSSYSPDRKPFNQGAVDKIGQARKGFVRGTNGEIVNFVEIELPAHGASENAQA